ncbi:MAG: hypothetical protein ACE5F3_00850 [Mariprofundaceae bacterium]
MRAGLWVKLKSAGPVGSFDAEMQRFTPWLPASLRPMLVALRRWIALYNDEANPDQRIAIEARAVQNLRTYQIDEPEYQLIADFLNQVEKVLLQSKAAREAALHGEPIDGGLEDRLIDSIQSWLQEQHQLDRRAVAAWLARLLECWRRQRGALG